MKWTLFCKLLLIGMGTALLTGMTGLAAAGQSLTDQEITHAVDEELMKDAATPADRIIVSTNDGIVSLKGTLSNILAKDRAESIAETVKGVRGVVNSIEVSAPFRTDIEIKEDVQRALLQDPATESWEISVSVTGGLVTLSGSVDSWQEKALASKVAKGVKGVKDIDNNIAVDYATRRGDVEIQHEIEKALRWDAYVDDALINVSVDNGDVILSGTVGSMAEKTRTEVDARVAGVKSVDSTGLSVKWWARDKRLRKGKYVSKSDPEIKSAIEDAFRIDSRVNVSDILIEVDDGIATLRGTVDNLKERRIAAQDARNIVGVWGVDNQLKVNFDLPPSDGRIEENVEHALVTDPYVERYEITVSVVEGEVYLYGEVDSTFEKIQADDLAARQKGVVEVHNYLTVKESGAASYSPYIDQWYLDDYGWVTTNDTLSIKTDWEIESQIKDELFWSPFVDRDDVNVTVEDGIAELTGTVDTWSEREAAEENALEGGAVAVDNDLAVAYGPDYYQP